MLRLQTILITKMNKNQKTRNGYSHLYNPKTEGLGTYDVHYINAYRKEKIVKKKQKKLYDMRDAA